MIINKILRFFLYWPFRITTTCSTIPFEPLKNLKIDKNKEIVYITVSSSVGNVMSIERAVQKLGLPSPFEELNLIGEKIPRICALRAPGLFTKAGSKDHDMEPIFRKWYEFYQRTTKDIQVIPITVLWSRNPGYETLGIHGMNAATPSFKKFFNLIFAGRDNCTIFCGSFNISESKERFEHSKFSKDLNRTFKLIFIQKARAVVGKPLPNRKQVIEEILQVAFILEASIVVRFVSDFVIHIFFVLV